MGILSFVIAYAMMSAVRAGTVCFKALNAVMGTGMAALGLVLLYDTIPTIISLLSLNTGWPGISVTSQGNYHVGI